MNRTLRRLTILFAAICVMMIMAVPSFATLSGKGAASYLISNRTIPTYLTTDTLSVKLIIQGRGYTPNNTTAMSETLTINLTGQTEYTVTDVLVALNNSNSTVKACDANGTPITSTYDYVYQFISGNNACGPLFYANHGVNDLILCDGWEFRINGQYPLLSYTSENGFPKGASILQTKIVDGDVIYFYFNHPWYEGSDNWSTKFVAADSEYVNGTLKVQIQWSDDYHTDAPFKWHIQDYNYMNGQTPVVNNFTNFNTSLTTFNGSIYNESGQYVTSFPIDKSTGYGEKTYTFTSGTYYLKVTQSKRQINRTGIVDPVTLDTETYSLLDSTMVYDKLNIGQ